MTVTIDYEQSIRKKRLIYHETARKRLFRTARNVFPCILALVVTTLLFAYAYFNAATRFIPYAFLPVLLMLFNLFLHNRLVRVNRKSASLDKNEIIRHLLRSHPGIIRHNCSDQVIIITDTSRSLLFKKMYLILQDDSDVYMHLSLTASGSLKYMLFPIPLYFMSQAILYSFAKRITNEAA